jgi:hypothetical protein
MFLAYVPYLEIKNKRRLIRSLCALCACIPPYVARQRLGKHIPAAKIHTQQ